MGGKWRHKSAPFWLVSCDDVTTLPSFQLIRFWPDGIEEESSPITLHDMYLRCLHPILKLFLLPFNCILLLICLFFCWVFFTNANWNQIKTFWSTLCYHHFPICFCWSFTQFIFTSNFHRMFILTFPHHLSHPAFTKVGDSFVVIIQALIRTFLSQLTTRYHKQLWKWLDKVLTLPPPNYF